MQGPLPKLHRVVVTLAAVVAFVAVGVWATFMLPYRELVTAGASVGLGIGSVCAYLLVHVTPQPRPTRRSRHR